VVVSEVMVGLGDEWGDVRNFHNRSIFDCAPLVRRCTMRVLIAWLGAHGLTLNGTTFHMNFKPLVASFRPVYFTPVPPHKLRGLYVVGKGGSDIGHGIPLALRNSVFSYAVEKSKTLPEAHEAYRRFCRSETGTILDRFICLLSVASGARIARGSILNTSPLVRAWYNIMVRWGEVVLTGSRREDFISPLVDRGFLFLEPTVEKGVVFYTGPNMDFVTESLDGIMCGTLAYDEYDDDTRIRYEIMYAGKQRIERITPVNCNCDRTKIRETKIAVYYLMHHRECPRICACMKADNKWVPSEKCSIHTRRPPVLASEQIANQNKT